MAALSQHWKMIHLAEVESTNSYIRDHASDFEGVKFGVVSADFQQAGRGQRGNQWESEPNANLLFSILCHPNFLPIKQQFHLSQIISLSIKETLDTLIDDISIKWPNDIYWKRKKICGILIENDLTGKNISHCIMGQGLNVNQNEFKSDAPNPVSIFQITGMRQRRIHILENILNRFEQYYTLLEQGKLTEIEIAYHQALFWRRGYHTFEDRDGLFNARIHHVEPSGLLVLKDTEGKLRKYAFKEVSYQL